MASKQRAVYDFGALIFPHGWVSMIDLTALARCCERIRQRVELVRHDDPGLADDLRSLGEAFLELQLNQRALAGAFLAKHYGYGMFNSHYQLLVTMAQEPDEEPAAFG